MARACHRVLSVSLAICLSICRLDSPRCLDSGSSPANCCLCALVPLLVQVGWVDPIVAAMRARLPGSASTHCSRRKPCGHCGAWRGLLEPLHTSGVVNVSRLGCVCLASPRPSVVCVCVCMCGGTGGAYVCLPSSARLRPQLSGAVLRPEPRRGDRAAGAAFRAEPRVGAPGGTTPWRA